MTKLFPKWTVHYQNIPDGTKYVSTHWEFYHDYEVANKRYTELKINGYIPSVRPFYITDVQYMGAADRFTLELNMFEPKSGDKATIHFKNNRTIDVFVSSVNEYMVILRSDNGDDIYANFNHTLLLYEVVNSEHFDNAGYVSFDREEDNSNKTYGDAAYYETYSDAAYYESVKLREQLIKVFKIDKNVAKQIIDGYKKFL